MNCCRLLNYCHEDQEKSTSLDKLYHCYQEYCYTEHIFPATKEHLTKVIEKTVGYVKRKHQWESRSAVESNRRLVTIFQGISCEKQKDQASSESADLTVLHVPDYCIVGPVDTPYTLSFSVPTIQTVNGVSVILDVTLCNSELHIRIGAAEVNLSILNFNKRCPLDQRHLDGVAKLTQIIRLCKGNPYRDECSYPKCVHPPEDWGVLGQAETERRVRWTSCTTVLSISAKGETCVNCQRGQRRLKFLQHRTCQDKENCKYMFIEIL